MPKWLQNATPDQLREYIAGLKSDSPRPTAGRQSRAFKSTRDSMGVDLVLMSVQDQARRLRKAEEQVSDERARLD
ncbi:MAG: hypothetical protein Q8N51_19785, partial [Gammaproteobacteria bacterium]|nr:hypothetical protein [Gammaproteobacteria bacterium]